MTDKRFPLSLSSSSRALAQAFQMCLVILSHSLSTRKCLNGIGSGSGIASLSNKLKIVSRIRETRIFSKFKIVMNETPSCPESIRKQRKHNLL